VWSFGVERFCAGLFLSCELPLYIQLSRGESWDLINRFNSATFLCLSQARIWISNIKCRVLTVFIITGSKKHPLSPFSFNKDEKHHQEIIESIDRQFDEDFIDRHGSPAWVVDANREISHSGGNLVELMTITV
jgi:hypothetical protein